MMEDKKCFAQKANMSSARSEREAEQIRICNAAMIEVAKTVNRYHIGMSEADREDAMGNACLTALSYIKPGKRGAIAYSERCGMTTAIRSGKKAAEGRRVVVSIDDEDNGTRMRAYEAMSGEDADSGIERREKDDMIVRLQRCVDSLPEAERLLVRMCADEIPYRTIAKRLGCTESTARKRMHDTRMKVIRMMAA